MQQKGFTPLVMVIILAIIGILGVYYLKVHKNSRQLSEAQPTLTTPTSTSESAPSLTPNPLTAGKKFGISYKIPDGWKFYSNADYKVIKLAEALPTPNEVATDLSGCVFYVGEGYRRDGPTDFIKNTPLTIDGRAFMKRSWSKKENGIPFFSYYIPSNIKPLFETMYSWTPQEIYGECEKSISAILSSLKFTQLK